MQKKFQRSSKELREPMEVIELILTFCFEVSP